MKTIALTMLLLLAPSAALAAEAIDKTVRPSEISVDTRLAERFAREALAEPADRPLFPTELVVRAHDGERQPFWRVKLVGSWKTAYVFAGGEEEGVVLIEDERAPKPATIERPAVGIATP